jgi:RNA polymerase sigma factor (sigma-70 family)
MLKPSKDLLSHEALFIERYERLLTIARRLPDVSPEQAQDLVQDAFIQFTVCQPSLAQIQNLDAYLQRMVRNLHASQIRRRPPGQSLPLETSDYETAELTLQATRNEQASAAVVEELTAICQYAKLRKETSRAGSALILRFFHGYYIHEVAQIFRIQKQPVYDLLRMARREARLFRKDSERLRFLGQRPDNPRKFLSAADMESGARMDGADDLLERLRDTIFSSCHTPCMALKQLGRSTAVNKMKASTRRLPRTLSVVGVASNSSIACCACLQCTADSRPTGSVRIRMLQ